VDIVSLNEVRPASNNAASKIGDLLWFGPLKALNKLAARLPMVLTGTRKELQTALASLQAPAAIFSILPKPVDAAAAAFLLRAALGRQPPSPPICQQISFRELGRLQVLVLVLVKKHRQI
jgi:hypothetical protein